MLGKLLKHEWRATIRRYALFYLVLGAMTLFAAVIHAIPVDNFFFNMAEGAVLLLYVITVIGVMFCSVGMAIVRFYKNMVSDEGYLTFTLPLTVDCHLMIKIASMFFWAITSIVTTLVGGLIIFGGLYVGYSDFSEEISIDFSEMLQSIFAQSESFVGAQVVLSILALLMSLFFQSMLIYLAVALGCMLFKKHRLVGSVISIYAVNRIYSFIFTVSMLISSEIGMTSAVAYLITMGFMIAVASAGIVGAYMGMRYILQKKLNLE